MENLQRPGALIVAAALLLSASASHARSLKPEEIEKLEDGWPILILLEDDDQFVGGSSHILVEEDIDEAWSAVQDAAIYPALYPTVLESTVIKTTDDTRIVKMVHGNKLVKATCYLRYKADDESRRLSWRLDKTKKNDLADARGSIRFSRYKDGRTLMSMSTILDIGNEFIEKTFGDRIVKGLLYLPYKFSKYMSRL